MLKHGAWRLRAGVGNGLTNGGDDLFHHLPILHAQIAGKLLLNRELDLRPNQSSTGGEEDSKRFSMHSKFHMQSNKCLHLHAMHKAIKKNGRRCSA
jgi:hypothetical protein